MSDSEILECYEINDDFQQRENYPIENAIPDNKYNNKLINFYISF